MQSFYAWFSKGIFFGMSLFLLTAIPAFKAQAHSSYFYANIYLGTPYLYSGYSYSPYSSYGYYGFYRSLRVPEIRTYIPTDTPSLQAITALGEMKHLQWRAAQEEPQALPLQPEPLPNEPLPLLPPEIKTDIQPELSAAAQEAFDASDYSL